MPPRTEYSRTDDNDLVAFLAREKTGQSKTGNNLWKILHEKPHKYPWGIRHPWQSWRERYVKNQEVFDRKIARYKKQHQNDDDKADDDTDEVDELQSQVSVKKRVVVQWTASDKRHLVEYLARDASGSSRLGTKLYQNLLNDPDRWPWAQRHSWQAWRERYRRNQEGFDRAIKEFKQKRKADRENRSGGGDRDTEAVPAIQKTVYLNFSEEDDNHLIAYLAQDRSGAPRIGNPLYRNLLLNLEKWPWAERHTWTSWRGRYLENKDWFESRIARQLGKYAARMEGPGEKATSGRKRKAEGECEERPSPGTAKRPRRISPIDVDDMPEVVQDNQSTPNERNWAVVVHEQALVPRNLGSRPYVDLSHTPVKSIYPPIPDHPPIAHLESVRSTTPLTAPLDEILRDELDIPGQYPLSPPTTNTPTRAQSSLFFPPEPESFHSMDDHATTRNMSESFDPNDIAAPPITQSQHQDATPTFTRLHPSDKDVPPVDLSNDHVSQHDDLRHQKTDPQLLARYKNTFTTQIPSTPEVFTSPQVTPLSAGKSSDPSESEYEVAGKSSRIYPPYLVEGYNCKFKRDRPPPRQNMVDHDDESEPRPLTVIPNPAILSLYPPTTSDTKGASGAQGIDNISQTSIPHQSAPVITISASPTPVPADKTTRHMSPNARPIQPGTPAHQSAPVITISSSPTPVPADNKARHISPNAGPRQPGTPPTPPAKYPQRVPRHVLVEEVSEDDIEPISYVSIKQFPLQFPSGQPLEDSDLFTPVPNAQATSPSMIHRQKQELPPMPSSSEWGLPNSPLGPRRGEISQMPRYSRQWEATSIDVANQQPVPGLSRHPNGHRIDYNSSPPEKPLMSGDTHEWEVNSISEVDEPVPGPSRHPNALRLDDEDVSFLEQDRPPIRRAASLDAIREHSRLRKDFRSKVLAQNRRQTFHIGLRAGYPAYDLARLQNGYREPISVFTTNPVPLPLNVAIGLQPPTSVEGAFGTRLSDADIGRLYRAGRQLHSDQDTILQAGMAAYAQQYSLDHGLNPEVTERTVMLAGGLEEGDRMLSKMKEAAMKAVEEEMNESEIEQRLKKHSRIRTVSQPRLSSVIFAPSTSVNSSSDPPSENQARAPSVYEAPWSAEEDAAILNGSDLRRLEAIEKRRGRGSVARRMCILMS